MIHLDTNFLIGALVPKSIESQKLIGWLRRSEPIAMSAVAWTEFLFGPVLPNDIALASGFIDECVPFDAEAATAAATLFNAGNRRKGSLTDCMIAGAAVADGAVLATNNVADFERFRAHGLVLEAV